MSPMADGPAGAPLWFLCLHGLGGSSRTLEPLVEGLRRAGHSVEVPVLAGHDDTLEAMAGAGWDDWMASAQSAIDRMSANGANGLVLVGQSIGATIALTLAGRGVACSGIVCINPVVLPPDPDVVEHLEGLLERGRTYMRVGPPDIIDPTVHEEAFEELPVRSLLEQARGLDELNAVLAQITQPVHIATSANDSVTDPANSDHLAAALPCRVTRVLLPSGGHVATLDLDRDLLLSSVLEFAASL